jgi:hypothetical protein
MQEHWPTAVLVWAACAGAGWWLLRDQVQQAITLLLIPTWIVCEWSYRATGYAHSSIYMARMDAVFATVMLTCFLRSKKLGIFWTLYVVGAISLLVSIGILSDGWNTYMSETVLVPLGLRIACALLVLGAVVGVWLWQRSCVWPVAMVAVVSYLLPWLPRDIAPKDGWQHEGPGLLTYVVVALTCAGFVWWGLKMRSRAAVNYGIAGFAATVLWFYLSSLLDKFGRSLGLIGLGVLFLAGGWALERLRRQLVAEMQEDKA